MRAHITLPILCFLGTLALVLASSNVNSQQADAASYQLPSNSGFAGQPSPDVVEHEVDNAVRSTESYWSAKFYNAGKSFVPVRRIIPYWGSGQISCGQRPLTANNAFYCPAGDFIAYDANFFEREYNNIGDTFIYFVIAHEYGHAIQARLSQPYNYKIGKELQADCLAGAYMGDSERAGTLVLEAGDAEEIVSTLRKLGDQPRVPWFNPEAHGKPEQRAKAFSAGLENSTQGCDLK